jgi:hypothetical protein
MNLIIKGTTKTVFLLFIVFIFNENYAQQKMTNLLFQSGFEEGVYIKPIPERAHYFWDIRGKDIMDWEKDLEEGISFIDNFFLNFVHARVGKDALAVLCPDPEDSTNQVLYFENRRNGGKGVTSRTQNEIIFHNEGDTFKQGFISYRFRLHENLDYLKQFPGKIDWFVITEWWEHRDDSLPGNTAGKSRVKLSIYKDVGIGKELYWHIEAQETQPVHSKTLWEYSNREVEVRTGEWFMFETFFKSGNMNEGRVWASVSYENSPKKVLFDVRDYTQHPDNPLPLRSWQCFKLYASETLLNFMSDANKPLASYYDDFEFWTGFPQE